MGEIKEILERIEREVEREGSERSQTIVDKVIALARANIVKLLHDRSEGSFAVVKGSRHQEIHALKSEEFQRWLRSKNTSKPRDVDCGRK